MILERNARVYIALVDIVVLLQEAREPVCQVYPGDTVPFYNIPTNNSLWFQFSLGVVKPCAHEYLESSSRSLNSHSLPIRLPAIHRLPRLLNRSQHGIVRDTRFGGDIRGLGLEVDVEGFDPF